MNVTALAVAVGLEHAGSDFGALSLAAALAQAALAAVLFTTRSRVVLQAVILLNLLFVQLYVLNVAVGLPPAIAHTHIGGTHQLWGMTLAWPGVVEWQGVLAKTTELIAVGCAVWCAHVGGARGALATPGRGE